MVCALHLISCLPFLYRPYGYFPVPVFPRPLLLRYLPPPPLFHFSMRRIYVSIFWQIGFGTDYELDDYLRDHPWSVQGGYVFLQWENGIWEYAVQFNDTTRYIPFPSPASALPISPFIFLFSLTFISSRKYISDLIFDYGSDDVAFPMASAMDREIIRYQQSLENATLAETLHYTFNTMQFPQSIAQIIFRHSHSFFIICKSFVIIMTHHLSPSSLFIARHIIFHLAILFSNYS